MNRKLLTACLLAALTALPSVASAERIVAEYQGSDSRTTQEFTVKGPWILDWRINSDYNNMVSFDLDLVDGPSGVLQGSVLVAKGLGDGVKRNGVRLFNTSGRYRFRINASFIRWHLKVKELTKEEAEQYTPIEKKGGFDLFN